MLFNPFAPVWAAWAVTSLGNLAPRMCHWSVLFARNPQWTCFSAVNTSRQDFIGILLEAETTLGTFLSQVSTGTNASLLQYVPPWEKKFGSSHSVCLLPLTLTYVYAATSKWLFLFCLKLGQGRQADWKVERCRGEAGKVDKTDRGLCSSSVS